MKKKRSSLIPYLIFTLFIALFVGFNIYAYKMMDSAVGFISEFGMLVIFTAFFVFVYIYILISLIVTEYLPQQKDVLYLFTMDGKTPVFVDKKGKKYIYDGKHIDAVRKNIGKCFNVEKNIFTVTKIENITSNAFEVTNIKEKYWFNFYCYLGAFEDIFLLPIVYVAATPFILSAILTPFPANLVIFAMTIPLLFIILYDFAYKQKRKKLVKKILEETDPIKRADRYNRVNKSQELQKLWSFSNLTMNMMRSFVTLVVVIGLTLFLGFILIKVQGVGKIAFLPFFIAILSFLVQAIVDFKMTIPTYDTEEEIRRKALLAEKIKKIAGKIYIFAFLSFWFGILLVGTMIALKDGEMSILAATIPFWIAGIAVLIKTLRN